MNERGSISLKQQCYSNHIASASASATAVASIHHWTTGHQKFQLSSRFVFGIYLYTSDALILQTKRMMKTHKRKNLLLSSNKFSIFRLFSSDRNLAGTDASSALCVQTDGCHRKTITNNHRCTLHPDLNSLFQHSRTLSPSKILRRWKCWKFTASPQWSVCNGGLFAPLACSHPLISERHILLRRPFRPWLPFF